MQDLNGIEENVNEEISKVQWQDIIYKGGNFISLDISKTCTGWVKCFNGELTTGTKSFKEFNEIETRFEFKKFVKELFEDKQYDFVCIEDVIGSTNFRTNKVLYQLNPIVDDMMYEGILKSCKIERIDNMQWKKTLRQITGEKAPIKHMDSKEEIRLHLDKLGCNIDVKQDILDAIGMAIAVIHRRMNGEGTGKKVKLKTDLTKSYVIKEYESEEEALKAIEKLQTKAEYKDKEIVKIEYAKRFKDINGQFKKVVTENDRDSGIYLIKAPLGKLGIVGVKKDLGLSKIDYESEVVFIAYLKVSKKRG